MKETENTNQYKDRSAECRTKNSGMSVFLNFNYYLNELYGKCKSEYRK